MARVRARQTLGVSLLALALGGCYAGVSELDGAGGDPAQGTPGEDDAGDDDGENSSCEQLQVGASPLRRLTRFEYDNAVRDLLGDTTEPAHNLFSPDEHVGGYAANAIAPISKTQLDQYASAAEDLAATFVDTQLDQWIDCSVSQTPCVTGFIAEFGRRAFRRPLEAVEVDEYVALYEDGLSAWDGTIAVRLVVEAMLMSPNFLYHVETMPQGAAETDVVELSAYELAARTSFFVWASLPDDILLDAAEAGELDTAEGLEAQVRRMLEDDRAADTLASFTSQWMHLEGIEDKVKDPTLFPQWDEAMADSMQRETTGFVDEVVRNGDATLGTLLTARWTMADATLAGLYGVDGPTGEFGRIELPGDQRAGVLTQAAFLTTNAHAAEVSWVYRGKFVRENLLCQQLPAPPIGVEVNDANDLGRLENDECSGCHLLMDPIGWGFDDYDAMGFFVGGGQPGEVSGAPEVGEFDGVVQLAESLAASTAVHDCVATQWFRYAARRDDTVADTCGLDDIKAAFAESGQDMRELIVAVAVADTFRYRTASEQ